MASEPLVSEELIARQSPEAQAIIRILLAKIAELEARLNQSPRNSSRPPSSRHPHAKPAPQKPASRNKPGGQPGHQKYERALIPTDQCHAMIPCRPTRCRGCGDRLSGNDPAPWRHQVWDLPEIQPLVTEYQRHRLTCTGCGETTCGALPDGVPHSQAGPRLVAFVALLMGGFKQSKRRVALFLEQVLNQPCSPGWVVKLQNQATAALTPAYQELAAQLPTEPVLRIDESPTKELFRLWSRCRDGTLTRRGFERLMQPIRQEIDGLLLRGVFSGNPKLQGMCGPLYERREWLWTFVDVAGVEPTNNASERVLRPAVIWRRLSFGTQSAGGSRFVETILTVVETCHRKRRSSFEYLTAATSAHFAAHRPPSLLGGV